MSKELQELDGMEPEDTVPSAPRKDVIADRLLEAMGADEMKDALGASSDPRALHLLRLMSDPRTRNNSIGSLRTAAKLSRMDLVDIFRDHKLSEAMIGLISKTPELFNDVAGDAMSRSLPCRTCKGFQVIKDMDTGETVECTPCDGSGVEKVPGDKDARKIVFEVLGLTGKQGPLVQVNTQNNFGSAPKMGTVVRRTDKILMGEVEDE